MYTDWAGYNCLQFCYIINLLLSKFGSGLIETANYYLGEGRKDISRIHLKIFFCTGGYCDINCTLLKNLNTRSIINFERNITNLKFQNRTDCSTQPYIEVRGRIMLAKMGSQEWKIAGENLAYWAVKMGTKPMKHFVWSGVVLIGPSLSPPAGRPTYLPPCTAGVFLLQQCTTPGRSLASPSSPLLAVHNSARRRDGDSAWIGALLENPVVCVKWYEACWLGEGIWTCVWYTHSTLYGALCAHLY